MNDQLTEKQITLLQRAGIFTDMTVEDVLEDEIEHGMWVRVRDEGPKDLIEFMGVIQNYTGWDDRSVKRFARATWTAARKLIATKTKKKTSRGGARPGAGRPSLGRVKARVSFAPATLAELKARAEAEGIPLGHVIDRMIQSNRAERFVWKAEDLTVTSPKTEGRPS